jgi:hypothetical protein
VHSFIRRAGVAGPLAAAFVLIACSDSSPVELSPALTTGEVRHEIVAGDAQSSPVGSELTSALVVRVTNSSGTGIQGQIVNWVVTVGGGFVFARSALTDANGEAREWWTLGPVAGANELEVRAVDSSTGEALVFARFRATGIDTVVNRAAPPPPSTISISASTFKTKGLQKVDLGWSGANSTSVDILRDGSLVERTANDGSHLDSINRKGRGSYRYRVCESGTTVCSGELQVNF